MQVAQDAVAGADDRALTRGRRAAERVAIAGQDGLDDRSVAGEVIGSRQVAARIAGR